MDMVDIVDIGMDMVHGLDRFAHFSTELTIEQCTLYVQMYTLCIGEIFFIENSLFRDEFYRSDFLWSPFPNDQDK